jgi:diguanylate cyclase (GGDEF)-like protein
MIPSLPNSIEDRLYVLRTRWGRYVAEGQFEQFIEFAVAVDSLAEYFNRLRLPGLVRLCEGLENVALAKLGDQFTHPIAQQDVVSLQRQMDALLGSVESLRRPSPERRADEPVAAAPEIDWIKPRSVWMIAAHEKRDMADALRRQLQFFGFNVFEINWGSEELPEDMPLAALFIPAESDAKPEEFACISAIRSFCPASQLLYLGAQSAMDPIVALIRAGIDVAIPVEEQPSMVLNCVLDLVQTNEQEQYRVLVVEDSRVAVALIQRTLSQHAIDTHAISDPSKLLEALESYRPDLVLMDMYMPRFNGVEATRVLRQMAAYNSLRLDGLTGLFNHTAAKSRLKAMVSERAQGMLAVAMIDIDHFKSINDTYGHPVGDQVIRGLAWLLKGRLRSIDLIGRYGGEEFLVALPDVSLKQARSVIDRIRSDFSALPHAHPGGALYATFSAGLSAYPIVDTAAGLTEAADEALMEAKRMGRNRVEKSQRGR